MSRISPTAILLKFRDGHATDMQSLYRVFGVRWPPDTTDAYGVYHDVSGLIDAGFLQADDPNLEAAKIGVTELLPTFQAALDISLTSLASFDRHRSMIVEPLFGTTQQVASRDSMCLFSCLSRTKCGPSMRITSSRPAPAWD